MDYGSHIELCYHIFSGPNVLKRTLGVIDGINTRNWICSCFSEILINGDRGLAFIKALQLTDVIS